MPLWPMHMVHGLRLCSGIGCRRSTKVSRFMRRTVTTPTMPGLPLPPMQFGKHWPTQFPHSLDFEDRFALGGPVKYR